MNEIRYAPVLYRTMSIGEVCYTYGDKDPTDDIVEMIVEVTGKTSQECLVVCLIGEDQEPKYIQYISQDISDVRMTDIFTLAVSLDMSGISVLHIYPEEIVESSAELSLYNAILDASHLLDMVLYGYRMVGEEDISSRPSDDASVLH